MRTVRTVVLVVSMDRGRGDRVVWGMKDREPSEWGRVSMAVASRDPRIWALRISRRLGPVHPVIIAFRA
jgi:hypothetical protein